MRFAHSYEQRRLAKIARNEAKLKELGLKDGEPLGSSTKKRHAAAGSTAGMPTKKRQRRRRAAQLPTRRSLRAKALPPQVYTEEKINSRDERKEEMQQRNLERKQGWRLANGKWRGERFGEVKNVAVGTVFGAGDFQRLGRFEMSRTGFFLPKVTPEWIDSSTKEVMAVIINNDNGLSKDCGAKIVYAGAGGRRRGQNRTAPQSFHQTWDSATNAAFRKTQLSGKPVRVIRGPKSRGGHGTAKTGGGYRYDGLYCVAKAELKPSGSRGLRTAFFTLKKL